MKVLKICIVCCLVVFSLSMVACNDGGGGSSDTGTVSMSITDAKPLLPENITNLFVEFSEVWVHQPQEGWVQLELVESPYTIDLLQFQDGNTTELVPPTTLSSGKYTQVRIVVDSARMRFDNGGTTEDRAIEVPSGKLRTDTNFEFNVGDAAADLVIHFDLAMSVVVSGPPSNPTYKLKPVLHLFEDPLQAATINGSIDNESFGEISGKAVVIVKDSEGQEFTRLEVLKSTDTEATTTEFSIFWLVPNQYYTVEIDLDKNEGSGEVPEGESAEIDVDCTETVAVTVDENDQEVPLELQEGDVFVLNGGSAIEASQGICEIPL